MPPPPETEAEMLADIETYRQERIADLNKPDGWLTLTGLYWLNEGENTVGSDSSNDLIFPAGAAPERIGSIWVENDSARMEVAPGVDVRLKGESVTSIAMDVGGESADVTLQWESLSWFLIGRDGKLGIRLKDSESVALAAFEGIDTFPVNLDLRLQGRMEWYETPKTLEIPTVLGTVSIQTAPGALVFDIADQTYRLDVTGERDDDAFFVVFGDETNGRETYGGGRYLWVDAPDENGYLTIDFNKSYNPPCVFTHYATCPFPTPENRLPIRLEAGEKKYAKEVV